MDENKQLVCATCEKSFEASNAWGFAYDTHNEKHFFCSQECLKKWKTKKLATMIITLAIGACITALSIGELGGVAFSLFFIPYILRQIGHSLSGIASGGWVGEFISFAVVLLGSMTIIYPAYKLIQEIREFCRLKQVYGI